MTLALYGKSPRRQRALLAAALLAVIGGIVFAVSLGFGGSAIADKPSTTGSIQVHKYLPKVPANANAPWTNQGASAGPWIFNVYTVDPIANPTATPVASGQQLDVIGEIPEQDVWVTETSSSGYTLNGFYLPDFGGPSGNAHCNQQPADGSTLVSPVLMIPAADWTANGNKTGLIHVCAFNTPSTPQTGSIVVTKVAQSGSVSDTTTFSGEIDDSDGDLISAWGPIAIGGSTSPVTVTQGDYSISESAPSGGWSLVGYSIGTGAGAAGCPTSPTAYTATSPDISVVTGQTTYVCVMNNNQAASTTSLAKSNSAGASGVTIAPNTAFSWYIDVTIGGAATTAAQTVEDTIPAGIAITGTPTTTVPGGSCSVSGQVVTCSVPAGTAVTTTPYRITVPVTTPLGSLTANCKVYTNQADIKDASPAITSNTDGVSVSPCTQPGITISKAHDPNTNITAGATFNWILTVNVTGAPTSAAQSVTDEIPTAFTVDATPGVSTTIPGSTCGVDANNTVTCSLPANTAVGSYTVTIPVTAPAGTVSGNCKDYDNTGHVGTTPSNTDTVTVDGCGTPSVTMSKSDDAPNQTVAAGGSFNWILTTTVSGAATTAAHAITDTIPAGFTVNSVTPDSPITCTSGLSHSVVCSLPSGAAVTTVGHEYKVTINVTAPAATPFANCKAYTNTANLDTTATNGDRVTVTGCTPPSVALDKTDNTNNTVAAGGAFDWTLKITVTDGPTIQATTVTDTIPAGFGIGTLPTGCSAVGQVVSCTLPAGSETTSWPIPVTAPAEDLSTNCKLYTNTASITAGGSGTDSDGVTVTGCNPPLVTIAKDDNVDGTVAAGGAFNWVITVTVSNGPTQADATVSDDIGAIPGGFVISGAITTTGGTGAGTLTCPTPSGNDVECTLSSGAGNGTYIITIPVQAPAASDSVCNQTYTNTAQLRTPDVTPATDDILVTCTPIITFTKSDNTDHVTTPGGTFNWVLTTKVSQGPTGADYTISDSVPAGFTISSISTGSDASLDCSASNIATGTVSCTLKKGAGNGDHVVTLSITAPAASDAVCNVTATNQATITNNTDSEDTQTSSDGVTVTCTPIVTLTKTDNTGGSVASNTAFNWVLTATVSNGPSATAQTITDTIPAGFTINSVTPSTGITCDAVAGQLVTCYLPAASANGSYTVTINVTSPHASSNVCDQTFTNTASMGELNPQDSVKVICQQIIVKKYSDPAGNMSGSGGLLNGWTITVVDSAGNTVATGATGANGAGTIVFLLDGGTYTVAETGQSGWIPVGSTVDGAPITGADSATRSADAGSEVDFFNQAVGSITIVKTETSVEAPLGRAGIGWSFIITGCGITRTGITGAPNGTVTFTDLPLCTYTITEDPNSKIGYTISPLTPNGRTVTLDAPGASGNIGFTNYENCTVNCGPEVQVTPSPTPSPTTTTPTPTQTTTTTPTSTPTRPIDNQETPPPSQTPSPSVTTGPESQGTPLPPVTGTGAGANSSNNALWMFLSGISLVVLTALFGAATIRRKRHS